MRIYDNFGDTFDRYTIVFKNKEHGLSGFTILGASPFPFHPQGVGCSDWMPNDPGGNHLGKRIGFSSLPDDVKKLVLDWLPLPNFRLPKAYSQYGAQMGRSDTAKGKCKLGKVRLYDGAYDIGGAYWGSPSDLYCAKSKTSLAAGYFDDHAKPGFSFVRANSAFEALKEFESMGLVF